MLLSCVFFLGKTNIKINILINIKFNWVKRLFFLLFLKNFLFSMNGSLLAFHFFHCLLSVLLLNIIGTFLFLLQNVFSPYLVSFYLFPSFNFQIPIVLLNNYCIFFNLFFFLQLLFSISLSLLSFFTNMNLGSVVSLNFFSTLIFLFYTPISVTFAFSPNFFYCLLLTIRFLDKFSIFYFLFMDVCLSKCFSTLTMLSFFHLLSVDFLNRLSRLLFFQFHFFF